jgi:hypothetical protein
MPLRLRVWSLPVSTRFSEKFVSGVISVCYYILINNIPNTTYNNFLLTSFKKNNIFKH